MYRLTFIKQSDFEKHVAETIRSYNASLASINLTSFNSNIIDPIKLLFDKNLYRKTFDEIISLEIHRQRDKSNTNAIGYFHQNMFKYIKSCSVPTQGWDVIFQASKHKVYVEMKNKHNTMNSSSSQKTYIQMQDQIMQTPNDYCYLVEVIAPVSRDIPWGCSVNGRHVEHQHIRRVSIDRFYREVTGISDAFYQICQQLPETIDKLVAENSVPTVSPDTVIEELIRKNPDTLSALYLLAFETYEGFNKLK